MRGQRPGFDWRVAADYSYHAKYPSWLNLLNVDGGKTYDIPSYWLANARVEVAPVELAVVGAGSACRNLFNKQYDLTRNFFGNRPSTQDDLNVAAAGAPRTATLTTATTTKPRPRFGRGASQILAMALLWLRFRASSAPESGPRKLLGKDCHVAERRVGQSVPRRVRGRACGDRRISSGGCSLTRRARKASWPPREAHPDAVLAQVYAGWLWMFLESPQGPPQARPFLEAAERALRDQPPVAASGSPGRARGGGARKRAMSSCWRIGWTATRPPRNVKPTP